MERNGSDILVDCLIAWGVDTIFGLPGDGINGVIKAIRKRSDRSARGIAPPRGILSLTALGDESSRCRRADAMRKI